MNTKITDEDIGRKTVTIYLDEEMTADEDGEDVPREDDLFTVQDDGGDYDDSEQLELVDAEGEVDERVDYYKDLGHTVIVRKHGHEVKP
jgi:hypothetical protein